MAAHHLRKHVCAGVYAQKVLAADGCRYEGDISAWGRKRVNLNNKDSESDYTMSSGLSPRGKEEEGRAEFDVEDGKRALAYQAGAPA